MNCKSIVRSGLRTLLGPITSRCRARRGDYRTVLGPKRIHVLQVVEVFPLARTIDNLVILRYVHYLKIHDPSPNILAQTTQKRTSNRTWPPQPINSTSTRRPYRARRPLPPSLETPIAPESARVIVATPSRSRSITIKLAVPSWWFIDRPLELELLQSKCRSVVYRWPARSIILPCISPRGCIEYRCLFVTPSSSRLDLSAHHRVVIGEPWASWYPKLSSSFIGVGSDIAHHAQPACRVSHDRGMSRRLL